MKRTWQYTGYVLLAVSHLPGMIQPLSSAPHCSPVAEPPDGCGLACSGLVYGPLGPLATAARSPARTAVITADHGDRAGVYPICSGATGLAGAGSAGVAGAFPCPSP